MKSFLQFVEESNIALLQAKRLGLVSDGHGGYHNPKTGEFTAKSVAGRLVFYNKRQKVGQQDPSQSDPEKRLSFSSYQVSEQELREKYIANEIFNDGDIVESLSTNMVGKIIRRGTNYLICVSEDNVMFKSWIKDLREVYSEKHMEKTMRDKKYPNNLVGTGGYLKNVIDKTPGALDYNWDLIGNKGKQFINKYRKK
jgi:hypothetical protein